MVLLAVLSASPLSAQVYKCKQDDGRTIYTDQVCKTNKELRAAERIEAGSIARDSNRQGDSHSPTALDQRRTSSNNNGKQILEFFEARWEAQSKEVETLRELCAKGKPGTWSL